MARKRSPSQKALAQMPDAAGGVVALRGELLARAGYTVEKQGLVTKLVIDGAIEDALHAEKVSRLVVGTGRGVSEVQTFVDADLALRARNREFLAGIFGMEPSKSQQAPPPPVVNVAIQFRQRNDPPTPSAPKVIEAKVIDVKPGRPS